MPKSAISHSHRPKDFSKKTRESIPSGARFFTRHCQDRSVFSRGDDPKGQSESHTCTSASPTGSSLPGVYQNVRADLCHPETRRLSHLTRPSSRDRRAELCEEEKSGWNAASFLDPSCSEGSKGRQQEAAQHGGGKAGQEGDT